MVRRDDGTVLLAGQAYDRASDFATDHLTHRAAQDGADVPPPTHPWWERLAGFDPRRVLFAHDGALWEPSPDNQRRDVRLYAPSREVRRW